MAIAHEIGDRRGKGLYLGNLGTAYSDLGQMEHGIRNYEQALAIASEIGDRRGEWANSSNLGRAYLVLGQVEKAIGHFEQSLAIVRRIGNQRGEGINLASLGRAYSYLGLMEQAIGHYEQALVIAREIGDRRDEGISLSNLGLVYSALGQVDHAIGHYEQALAIAREIGNQYGSSLTLAYAARSRLVMGEAILATAELKEALRIAEDTGYAECKAEAHIGLALTGLLSGKLDDALAAARAARAANYVRHLPAILALEGTLCLRSGDDEAARASFAEAVQHADDQLEKTARLYSALDAKGLAFSGLALCQGPKHAEQATEAYRAARAITAAPGIVQQALQLFDALAVADTGGLLRPVRKAIAGNG